MDSDAKVITIVILTLIIAITYSGLVPYDLTCESYQTYNDGQSIQFRDCYYNGTTTINPVDVLVDIE